MRKLSILFALYASNLLAADCVISNGKSSVTVPEATAVSLYSPGKSLEKHKLQDQDGLGTCYANAASSALTSILPGRPEISYLHAAVASKAQNEAGWSTKDGKYMDGESTDFTYGGDFCKTVEGLKKAGGACPTNLSLLENNSITDPEVQARVIKGMGQYFDILNNVSKNPAGLAGLKKDLKAAFDLIDTVSTDLKRACLERKASAYPSYSAFQSMMFPVLRASLKKPSPCGDEKVYLLQQLMSEKAVLSKQRMFVDPGEEIQEKFQRFIAADPELGKVISAYVQGAKHDDALHKVATKKLYPKLNKFLNDNIKSEDPTKSCITGPNSFLLGPDPEEDAGLFLTYMRLDKQAKCKGEVFEEDAKKLVILSNEQKECLAPSHLYKILDAVLPLLTVGVEFNKQLYDKLLDPQARYAHQLTNAIMPGCLEAQNLIKIDQITCKDTSFCDAPENGEYLGPKGKCYDLEAAKALARVKVLGQINMGQALGVAVCTGFMTDAKARTKFCTVKVQGVEGHALHEMAISGYRCTQGKIEYEVLNSWGSSCPDSSKNKQDGLECQKDQKGRPNGRFWVKEDILIDNSFQLSTLGKAK